jgi:hypothetical protein
MSRKVHPVGFRLGVSQHWQLPQPIFNYHEQLIEQLSVYLWIQNFTAQNAFYCLSYSYHRITPWFKQLNLSMFVPLRRSIKRLRVRLFSLAQNIYSLRRRRKGKALKHKKTNFLRRIAAYALVIKLSGQATTGLRYYFKQRMKHALRITTLWNSYFWVLRLKNKRKKKKKKLRSRFSVKYKKSLKHIVAVQNGLAVTQGVKRLIPLRSRKRGLKRVASKQYLVFLLSRLNLLRLKFFIEKQLNRYISGYLVVQLSNINDLFLNGLYSRQHRPKYTYMRLVNASKLLVNKLNDYSRYSFLTSYTNLLVAVTLVRVPHVLLQWLWLYAYRIKKHSLYLTHNQLFSIFEKSLENIILLVGLVKGAKMEVTGKLFDSTRTRKQITYYGHQYKRQSLVTSFVYAFKQIPTYIGVLGFRLWFIY